MTRCYEREHFRANTRKDAGYNHCGAVVVVNGFDYCSRDGKLLNYVGTCAAKSPPQECEEDQFDLFSEM